MEHGWEIYAAIDGPFLDCWVREFVYKALIVCFHMRIILLSIDIRELVCQGSIVLDKWKLESFLGHEMTEAIYIYMCSLGFKYKDSAKMALLIGNRHAKGIGFNRNT